MTRGNSPSAAAAFELVNDRDAIDAARDQVVEAMEVLGYPPASVFAVRLAFEEAVSNAFVHGHKDLPEGVPVRLRYRVEPGEVEVVLEDRGPGFSPDSVPDPTLDENLERPTGRGLMLIRAYMASVEFNPAGNRIRMVYQRPKNA